MPNHMHGLLILTAQGKGEASAGREFDNAESLAADASPLRPIGTQPGSLGAIIQNFKTEYGLVLPDAGLSLIYLAAFVMGLILLLRPKPIEWPHWSGANLFVYGVLFLFGKQAFGNYYYLLALMALLHGAPLTRTETG